MSFAGRQSNGKFEGMEEALSSGENPRPGGIGQSEARRCVLVAMGLAFTKIWERLVGKTEAGILMVELDTAGQTTILYKLKLGEIVTTITPIGRKVETVQCKNLRFAMRSAGGQDKIQPRRRQYYLRIHGLVYAVDSNDRDRIEEANEELIKVPNEDEMCDAAVLVFYQRTCLMR